MCNSNKNHKKVDGNIIMHRLGQIWQPPPLSYSVHLPPPLTNSAVKEYHIMHYLGVPCNIQTVIACNSCSKLHCWNVVNIPDCLTRFAPIDHKPILIKFQEVWLVYSYIGYAGFMLFGVVLRLSPVIHELLLCLIPQNLHIRKTCGREKLM